MASAGIRGRVAALVVASVGALSAALHCGSTGDSKFAEDACEKIYKDKCGTPCTKDDQCATGLYCGDDDKCTAQCGPGVACPDGIACSPHGRCGPDDNPFTDLPDSDVPSDAGDGGATDAICAATEVQLTKILPKVLFLLDQSSSMYWNKFPSGDSNSCNPDCRWSVLKDVLIGPAATPGGLIKQLETEAEIGFEMYSATDAVQGDGDDSLLPPPTDNVCPRFNGKKFNGVTFAVNAFATFNAQLRDASVDDDTPTGPAIRTVIGLGDDGGVVDGGFAAVPQTAPKVLVLVTDGEPAICGDNSPSDAGRAQVISAVQQTFKQNIRTFVIAIGDTTPTAETHFRYVANAGQGQDLDAGDAGAVRPATKEQLVDALKKIVLDARTCVFNLDGQVQAGSEKLGVVKLNGNVVPFDEPGPPEEGWRLNSPTQLELLGTACETLKATPNATLSAVFPCGAVTPIPLPH